MRNLIGCIILGMAMLIPWPVDAVPTTVPSPDDAPAPAAMAPMYVAIGKELSLRLALVRRTLDDLKLDRPIRQRADQIVDTAAGELKYLLAEIQAGAHAGDAAALGRAVESWHDPRTTDGGDWDSAGPTA